MIRITSRTNQTYQKLLELKTTIGRQTQNLFLVEGEHLVTMAYEKGYLCQIITINPRTEFKPPVEQLLIDENLMKKLSYQTTPPGLIGVCKTINTVSLKGERLIYLDGISDPGNVGTILRTSLAFGFEGAILGPGCASIYNEKVIAASQGAIFSFRTSLGDYNSLLDLKKQGFHLVATGLSGKTVSMEKSMFNPPFIFIFGNESHGVSQPVLALADITIKIPMKDIDSLNVAVAAGILLYEATRK